MFPILGLKETKRADLICSIMFRLERRNRLLCMHWLEARNILISKIVSAGSNTCLNLLIDISLVINIVHGLY